jgi:predicted TIM-barrel fold metal-dependent hydrolase
LIRAGYEPEPRVEFQKEANVEAEVLYPTTTPLLMQSQYFDALKAVAEVYNDWMQEYCSYDPKRLLGLGIIPIVDVDWAIKELDRCVKKGFRGVIINVRASIDTPPYRDPMYDPFWARIAESGIVLTLHPLNGWVPDTFHPQKPEDVGEGARLLLKTFNEIQGTLGNDFIFGGIFDRHPTLKLVCSEFEMSWLKHFMWRIDRLQEVYNDKVRMAKLERKASEYVLDRTWHGWVDDGFGAEAVGYLGTDRVMWGSDFPHIRSMSANAQSETAKMLNSLPAEAQTKIVADNAAKLYRLN